MATNINTGSRDPQPPVLTTVANPLRRTDTMVPTGPAHSVPILDSRPEAVAVSDPSAASAAGWFAIRVLPARELVVVKPVGELDLAGVPRLREQVRELIGVGFDHVAIDLRELSFIDVAGVRLLLWLAADARDSGWRLSVIRGPAAVDRVVALTATRERLPFTTAFSPARPGTGREP